MKAGALRHAITIEVLTSSADEMGGQTRTWATHVSTWAEVAPARSNERFFGEQIEAVITHRITMRYQAGITTQMRVLFGARYFQIKGIVNRDERSIMLDLMCEEGVAS